MEESRELLENTDWSVLHHAYDFATDTPEHLEALLVGDEASVKEALDHLWSAILHQGTPWTATAPVATFVISFMQDKRIERFTWLPAFLMAFLADVAQVPEYAGISNKRELEDMGKPDYHSALLSNPDDVFADEDLGNAFYAHSLIGCIRLAPQLWHVMQNTLTRTDINKSCRMSAVMGAASLVKLDSFQGQRTSLETQILALAKGADSVDERSTYILALNDLGCSSVAFLNDPSPAIRYCSALSKAPKNSDIALDELSRLLAQYSKDQMDAWFDETPPQFNIKPYFVGIQRLVSSERPFDQYLNVALCALKTANKHSVDYDWGVLLAAAFSDSSGQIKTPAQYYYLKALVANKALWDESWGNAFRWFKEAGLPYDRSACQAFLSEIQLEDIGVHT